MAGPTRLLRLDHEPGGEDGEREAEDQGGSMRIHRRRPARPAAPGTVRIGSSLAEISTTRTRWLTRPRGMGFALNVGVDPSRRALLRRAGVLTVPWLVSWPRRAWSQSGPRSVRDYGARGDGKANDTAAIQAAIDSAALGGVVLFPPGDYVSGTLHLRSRLVL